MLLKPHILTFLVICSWPWAAAVRAADADATSASSTPASPQGGFIDTHAHAFDCRKDGLDVVAIWMERMHVTQCIIHPLMHKGSRPGNEEERQEMLANYRKYKGRIYRFCIIYPDEVKTVEDAVKILEQEIRDGAIGFGEHYGVGLRFDDPKNLLFYEACCQVGLPVMFHIDQIEEHG